mgnify:CR=1 FL=1
MAIVILGSQGDLGPKGDVDLTLSISDEPDPVKAGGGLTYTIFFKNAGKREASSVVLASGLPEGVSFVSSTPAAPSCRTAGAAITCNLGNKPGGSEGKVRIHVTVDPSAAGTITYTATVRAEQEEKITANNRASQETTVQ